MPDLQEVQQHHGDAVDFSDKQQEGGEDGVRSDEVERETDPIGDVDDGQYRSQYHRGLAELLSIHRKSPPGMTFW